MKLTIVRHEGYAGTSETLAVKDSAVLAPAASVALRATVDRIKSLSQEHRPVGADFVRYELQIEESGSQATVAFKDDGSEIARQLVELVNTISAA